MKEQDKIYKNIWFWVIIVVLLWCVSWFLISQFYEGQDRGFFGDQFGAINALFSGLAFAGVIVTLFYQKEELKSQRIDVIRQSFERNYFQLLSLHSNIVKTIKLNRDDEDVTTRRDSKEIYALEFFEMIAGDVVDEIAKNKADITPLKKLNISYQIIFDEYRNILSHYFRNLYHIIRYINEAKNISKEDKESFIKITRAQLSSYELVMLAYNGLSERGKEFKKYIEDYELLKNIDFEFTEFPPNRYIVSPEVLSEQYPHLKPIFDEQKQIHGYTPL